MKRLLIVKVEVCDLGPNGNRKAVIPVYEFSGVFDSDEQDEQEIADELESTFQQLYELGADEEQ